MNEPFSASIFTFSLGDDADTEILPKIACQNTGAYTHIADADGDNLIFAM